MKIYDEEKNLIALLIVKDEIKEGTNFETTKDHEFQIGSFSLSKNTVIENHVHLNQNRRVIKTSEVLVVLEGEMEVTIFNNNQEYIDIVTVRAGDTIALLSGGHGIKINEDCKFVEVKQGPYVEEKDKIRF